MRKSVRRIMQPCEAVLCERDSPGEAAKQFLSTQRVVLPVVDERGCPVGILRLKDLSRVRGRSIRSAVRPAPLIVGAQVSAKDLICLMVETGAEYAMVQDHGELVGEVTWIHAKRILDSV